MPANDQFSVGVDAGESVSRADLIVFNFPCMFGLVFHPDETPDFISLHEFDLHILDKVFLNPKAFLADNFQQAHDRVAVNVCYSLDTANAHSFNEQM